MQKSLSPHAQFFTSLKHLEKRLKLEEHQAAGASTLPSLPPVEGREIIDNTQQTDSLGTPIYVLNQSATICTNASNIQESEAPQEFLSRSPDSPPTNPAPPDEGVDQPERFNLDNDDDDDIELLMQLLRLSDSEELAGTNDAGSDDEFYNRIVGVKGPKNVKVLERLERWIKHFSNGEKQEPFRLAHLLLGKAAFMNLDDGFGGLVFPSTINEFLQNDPPID